MVGPYLLSLLDAGIALQGLITQVVKLPIHRPGGRYVRRYMLMIDGDDMPWNHGYGVMVTVESWLWNPCYAILTAIPARESWLWNRDCEILAVESLQLPGNGFLAWESWLRAMATWQELAGYRRTQQVNLRAQSAER